MGNTLYGKVMNIYKQIYQVDANVKIQLEDNIEFMTFQVVLPKTKHANKTKKPIFLVKYFQQLTIII